MTKEIIEKLKGQADFTYGKDMTSICIIQGEQADFVIDLLEKATPKRPKYVQVKENIVSLENIETVLKNKKSYFRFGEIVWERTLKVYYQNNNSYTFYYTNDKDWNKDYKIITDAIYGIEK